MLLSAPFSSRRQMALWNAFYFFLTFFNLKLSNLIRIFLKWFASFDSVFRRMKLIWRNWRRNTFIYISTVCFAQEKTRVKFTNVWRTHGEYNAHSSASKSDKMLAHFAYTMITFRHSFSRVDAANDARNRAKVFNEGVLLFARTRPSSVWESMCVATSPQAREVPFSRAWPVNTRAATFHARASSAMRTFTMRARQREPARECQTEEDRIRI